MVEKEKKSKDVKPEEPIPESDLNNILATVKEIVPNGAIAKLFSPCSLEPQEEMAELHLIGSESMILKILGKE